MGILINNIDFLIYPICFYVKNVNFKPFFLVFIPIFLTKLHITRDYPQLPLIFMHIIVALVHMKKIRGGKAWCKRVDIHNPDHNCAV